MRLQAALNGDWPHLRGSLVVFQPALRKAQLVPSGCLFKTLCVPSVGPWTTSVALSTRTGGAGSPRAPPDNAPPVLWESRVVFLVCGSGILEGLFQRSGGLGQSGPGHLVGVGEFGQFVAQLLQFFAASHQRGQFLAADL